MVRDDVSLVAILKTLSSTPCPTCLSYRLEFLLRCDLVYGECLPTAHCTSCGSSLALDRHFGQRVRSAVEEREVGACLHCQSGETRLTFLCPLTSRRSEAVGFCNDCHHEFALAELG